MTDNEQDNPAHWLRRLKSALGLRLMLVYGVVFAVSILCIAGLSLTRVSVLIDQVIQTWGESMAEQLAQATLDAVMQKDDIALQAHLGRFLKTGGVVSATVYDVQNTLLAQSGATPRELRGRTGLHTFPATLALGDNAIGRVVVVIDAGKVESLHHELYWIMVCGGGLALLLIMAVSYRLARQAHALHCKASAEFIRAMPKEILPASLTTSGARPLLDEALFNNTLDALGHYVEQLQRPSPASLLAAAADLINPADACACVIFEVRKLDVLQRQVSRERLRVLLNLYQQHIENAGRLYGAQRVPVAGACIKMIFPAKNNQEDAAFQATCCAYVLAGLLRDCADPEMGISLQWAMALDWHAASSNELLRNVQRSQDEQRSHWVCEQIGSGQFACSTELAERLKAQDKFELVETNGSGGHVFYRIGAISDNHRRMLERQIEQLRDI